MAYVPKEGARVVVGWDCGRGYEDIPKWAWPEPTRTATVYVVSPRVLRCGFGGTYGVVNFYRKSGKATRGCYRLAPEFREAP